MDFNNFESNTQLDESVASYLRAIAMASLVGVSVANQAHGATQKKNPHPVRLKDFSEENLKTFKNDFIPWVTNNLSTIEFNEYFNPGTETDVMEIALQYIKNNEGLNVKKVNVGGVVYTPVYNDKGRKAMGYGTRVGERYFIRLAKNYVANTNNTALALDVNMKPVKLTVDNINKDKLEKCAYFQFDMADIAFDYYFYDIVPKHVNSFIGQDAFSKLDKYARIAIMDMAYNMAGSSLNNYGELKKALTSSPPNYVNAAYEMQNSRNYESALGGVRKRVLRNLYLMLMAAKDAGQIWKESDDGSK